MPEDLLARETVFEGALLTVHRDVVRLSDGAEGVREWVQHPGAAAVVPVFENGDTVLVRQFRYATGREFLEVPAGKIDRPGESPAEVAARELEEETGLRAARLQPLGTMHPCIGYSDEVIHLFLATGLSAGVAADNGAEEQLTVVRMPFADALRMARTGEIDDAKSVVALLRADEARRG